MRKWITGLISVAFFSIQVHSQGIPSAGAEGEDMLGEKNFAFLPIPYLNYDRSLGFQAGALPLGMYRVNPEDTVSPASITGLFGMYTSNESWFTLFFQQFYLNEDKWRITAAGGYGSVNFQFYMQSPINRFIDYNTAASFLYGLVQRRIVKNLYGGFHYVYVEFKTVFEDGEVKLESPSVFLNGVGADISFDSRSDVYYPRDGILSNVMYTSFPDFLDNVFESQKIDFDINKYWSVRHDKDVLAGRLFLGSGIGELSFQQQYVVGLNDFGDIRGYTQSTYRGDQLYALQSEYRWNYHKTLSQVFFLGVATVQGSFNEEHNGKILPGIGTGFRVNVAPQYHMNVGMDVAAGIDDWGIYFRIGEAF